jgi:uncharacterized protein YbaR (Trm112 family)
MPLAPELLELLRCPESREKLIYFPAGEQDGEEFLFCPSSRLKYRVEGDIPVMLIDEAERLDEGATSELCERARARGLLETP